MNPSGLLEHVPSLSTEEHALSCDTAAACGCIKVPVAATNQFNFWSQLYLIKCLFSFRQRRLFLFIPWRGPSNSKST